MSNDLFRLIARFYPTERIGSNRILASIWRVLFYLIRPSEQFEMRTKNYDVIVHPNRNSLTRTIIRRGYWEKSGTDLFISCLVKGGMIVDAGANFGHYSLTAANCIGPEGLIFAFEPHRETFHHLQDNCRLQNTENIRAIEAGLGEREDRIPFYSDVENPGGHSFCEAAIRKTAGLAREVAIHPLDSFLMKNAPSRKLNVLKIDVQGFEAKVLLGARGSIREYKPYVFCEITPLTLLESGSSHEELIGFFRNLDYRARVIEQDKNKYSAISLDELKLSLDQTTAEYFDVLFEPEIKHNV